VRRRRLNASDSDDLRFEVQVQLSLESEARFADLLPPLADGRFEASGVALMGTTALVVFDNSRRIAALRIAATPRPGRWITLPRGAAAGFEDIAYSGATKRHYLLVEAAPVAGRNVAVIEEYDQRWRLVVRAPIDRALERRNKGCEALAVSGRYLLAMLERGGGGKPSVLVLTRDGDRWHVEAEMPLPRSARFRDYSSLAVSGRRIGVLSQEDGRLWLGRFDPRQWRIVGRGRVYEPPLTKKGKKRYCNLEGLAWLSTNRIVVVSDRAKRGSQPKRCRKRDESIHVFRLR
jgi:hypothetical protein